MVEENKPIRRQILDDLFDAYTILGKGSYVSLYDTKGQMTRYSPAAVELFGLPGEYIPIGAYNWSDYVHPEDRRRYENVMKELILGTSKHYDLSYRTRLKDGSYSLFRYIGTIIRDSSGKPELIGGIMINEGLLDNTDPATILRNQYGFFQDLSAVMELKKNCIILLITINEMSNINEVYGYGYGNRILQQVAWFLQENVGLYGTIYRMDGAKFAFLTEHLSLDEVAEKYEQLKIKLATGIPIDNVRQNLIISGGMIYTAGKSINERALYSCLSYACRESKLHKNGNLVSFDGSWNLDTHETLQMIDEIRNCILLDCEGFSLKYQLIVDSKNEKPFGAEVFINWHSDNFGEVPSTEYIPILERDFVFEELGYWVLRQAMKDGKQLIKYNDDFLIGVDIVQVQLEDEFFIRELKKISEQTKFPLKNLCLILNKSCRLLDIDFLKNVISTLHREGVKFIIDEFGSGLSSIDFLINVSPDYIRFNKKYIAELNKKPQNQQILLRLSELASACKTKVSVTGVENQETHDILINYPADNLQGDFYSPPMTIENLIQNVQSRMSD